MTTETIETMAEALERRPKREKKIVHWIVLELFKIADERNLDERQLEALILEKTGQRIPPNTLRYWKGLWSEPKISEVDLIATALDYELDLILVEKKS